MKSLLKITGLIGLVGLLFLTGCNRGPRFDVSLQNGREIAVETDYFQMSNQELFELVASSQTGFINVGVSVILGWADAVILQDQVEIDEEMVEFEYEMLTMFFDDEQLQDMLLVQGFENVESYLDVLRLGMYRINAQIAAVDIADEQIESIYENMFALDEGEEPDEDRMSTEEIKSAIRDILIEERLDMLGFDQYVLANIRYEAQLVIHSKFFGNLYEEFLTLWGVDDLMVETTTNSGVIASVNGHELTNEEFFRSVALQAALTNNTVFFNHLDRHILDEMFEINNDIVREDITNAKLQLLDNFYPQMAMQGLTSEQEIFDAFWLAHLQELAFYDAFGDVTEERLLELYENHIENLERAHLIAITPQRAARHILVEDEDLAIELISRLEDASATELEDLFIELASIYSVEPGADERGGDLGMFPVGRMVPEFNDAVFAMDLYRFSDIPVETVHGFHIIYLYEIADEVDHDDLQSPYFGDIRENLRMQELGRIASNPEYFNEMMFNIRRNHNVRFHYPVLQAQFEVLDRLSQLSE